MAEIEIKKKKPVWPWIILILIILAILYFVFIYDDGNDMNTLDNNEIEQIDEPNNDFMENNNMNDSDFNDTISYFKESNHNTIT